jgi:hypothetical protein
MGKMTRLVLVIMFFTGSAYAQDAPRVEVSAGYSFLRLGATGGLNQNGANFSLAGNVNRWFGVVGDFGGYYSSPLGVSLDTYTFLVGPRFSLRRNGKVTPFVQVLVGGAHLAAGTDGFSFSATPFVISAGAGIDLRISQHVALRPQVDYLNFRSGGQSGNAARASLGIVYRFGGR